MSAWLPKSSTAATAGARISSVKNGLAPNNGKQKYLCHACGRQSREDPSPNGYTEERKEEILRAYQERSSLRGLQRTFGVSPTTVIGWLKKSSRA